MEKLILMLTEATRNATKRFARLSRRSQFAIIIVVIILLGVMLHTKKTPTDEATENKSRYVTLSSVAALSANVSPIPLLGTVTSRSEATIRAEGSGKLIGVYKKLGDFVGAGEVIAEFDNSGERAQVLQAEGAYEAAKAGRDIAGISSGSASNSLTEARTQAQNTIESTYTALDDAIRTKTDNAWRNPQTRDAKLIVGVSDAKLVIELEQERVTIETMLRARDERNKTLSPESDLVAELTSVESEANTVKDYLDDLSLAFNRALPDANASPATIEGYKASTAIARSSVNGTLSAIAASRNALKASIAAAAIAQKSGSESSGNSTADAQLKSALGNLRAAQARLEKTIIRSPISGTLNSLSVDTGDFVSPFTEIAVVSNNGALEVVAYVTEDDARELSIGAKVSIDGTGSGVITRIAPALDPRTKKIEVRIGINTGSSFINGQSVRVEAMRVTKRTNDRTIRIPLSALKITPNGTIVFTVSTSSTLVAHTVIQGSLLGDQIEIKEGLTPDMLIVTDARGLQDAMAVSIK